MRMSASSSTISMSCAMGDRAQLHRLVGRIGTLCDAGFGGSKDKPDPRPFRLGIFQHQLSLMIFHDLLDDGETEARPFGPGRDIRLGQALAALLGQALTVVLDNYPGLARSFSDDHADMALRAGAMLCDSRLDRFDRILDDIDQCLTDEPRIAADHHRMLGKMVSKAISGW